MVVGRIVTEHASASRGRRTHVLGSLCAFVFLVNFGRIVFAPLLDPFMTTFGVGPARVGIVATLAWLGSALPRIPTGYLLTRVSRQHVVLGTGVLLAGSSAATSRIPDDIVLRLGALDLGILAVGPITLTAIDLVGFGAFVVGLASGAYFIAANPLVSELFPDRVGRVLGIHGTASQLAAVAAPIVVSVVLAGGSWRDVFVLLALGAALATISLVWTSRHADMPTAGTTDRHLLRAVRRQWRIVFAGVAIIGATGFVWNGLFNFYVPYLTATKGLDPGTANTLLTVVFAAGVPAFWVTGNLADRFPHVPLMLSILGGFVVLLFAFTFVQGLWAIVAVTVVMGYVIHSLFPALDTYLLDNLPDEDRSSAYAAYSGTMMVFQATASAVVGALVETQLSYNDVFRGFGVALVVILLVLLGLHAIGRLPSSAR